MLMEADERLANIAKLNVARVTRWRMRKRDGLVKVTRWIHKASFLADLRDAGLIAPNGKISEARLQDIYETFVTASLVVARTQPEAFRKFAWNDLGRAVDDKRGPQVPFGK